MARPVQRIDVYNIQHRPKLNRPWIVRWAVDGKVKSRAWRTRAEANRYRSQLTAAATNGEAFDPTTREPASWGDAPATVSVFAWTRQWLEEQWPEWQPRTRYSGAEALARFIPLAVQAEAPPPPPGLRRYLMRALQPDAVAMDGDETWSEWVGTWSLDLRELTKAFLATVERQLGVGDKGQQLSQQAAGRNRKIARACIRRAVELDVLTVDPWPVAPAGRSRRTAVRPKKRLDIRTLPDPATMAKIIDAIPNNYHRSSHTYQAMTAVAYYGGLRPSEVRMLRPRALDLPTGKWGRIDVREADAGNGTPGPPKTGPRDVPIPPVLVGMLNDFLEVREIADDNLVFLSSTGRVTTPGNWTRTLHLALDRIGHPWIRVYDCRHAAATTWLQAGVPLGEVARRLGHSVETLVSTYVGALANGDDVANQQIERMLDEHRGDEDRS